MKQPAREYSLGVLPKVARDLSDARTLLARDGAVIVDQVDTDSESAAQLMTDFLGETGLAVPEPARVFEGGEGDRHQLNKTHHDALPVHTDGFAYGDLLPDCLLLVCVQSSSEGGESFLVDGYSVYQQLAENTESQWVTKALTEVAVDQTEDDMQKSLSPIVQHTTDGRMMVRRTLDQLGNGPTPLASSADPERDAEMIAIWTEAIESAAVQAPRFALKPNQALFVDNYRVFHAREGYSDPTRMLWRVWGWSTSAKGVPDIPLFSDARYASTGNA